MPKPKPEPEEPDFPLVTGYVTSAPGRYSDDHIAEEYVFGGASGLPLTVGDRRYSVPGSVYPLSYRDGGASPYDAYLAVREPAVQLRELTRRGSNPTNPLTVTAYKRLVALGPDWRWGSFTIAPESLLGLYCSNNNITLATGPTGVPPDATTLDVVLLKELNLIRIIFASKGLSDGQVFQPTFDIND